MSTIFNPDIFISRLQERHETSTIDEYCLNCGAQVTEADIENDQTCTQCESALESDDEDLKGED